MEQAIFTCSICGDDSSEICVYCTKDACGNHLCERCRRCSDCCSCEMPRTKQLKQSAGPSASYIVRPPKVDLSGLEKQEDKPEAPHTPPDLI